jgi:hypothetical protein
MFLARFIHHPSHPSNHIKYVLKSLLPTKEDAASPLSISFVFLFQRNAVRDTIS